MQTQRTWNDSFQAPILWVSAMAGNSDLIRSTLDIGHHHANFDAVDYTKKKIFENCMPAPERQEEKITARMYPACQGCDTPIVQKC